MERRTFWLLGLMYFSMQLCGGTGTLAVQKQTLSAQVIGENDSS